MGRRKEPGKQVSLRLPEDAIDLLEGFRKEMADRGVIVGKSDIVCAMLVWVKRTGGFFNNLSRQARHRLRPD